MQDFLYLWILIGLGVIFAAIGCVLGMEKGRPGSGLLFGLALGPIGPVLVLLLPAREKMAKSAQPKHQPVSTGGAVAVPLARWEESKQPVFQTQQPAPQATVAQVLVAPRNTLSASANQPPARRLRRLEALRSQGLISEEEYQQKRQEILAEL